MEIERKFLIPSPPELAGYSWIPIEQGYLALADGEGGAEVRLRRGGDELWLTVKGGSGQVRTEEELRIDRGRFESLWPLTAGRRVAKTRYLIPHDELTIELDVYEGPLEGLVTAEVEFQDEEQSNAFEPPEWFGRELTGERAYANEHLATQGKPPN